MLLFAERPERHLPGACISLASYRHAVADGNTSDSRQITGPLPEQISQVLTYFASSPLIPTVSRKGPDGRHDFPSYASGAAMPIKDSLIAAAALAHGLVVATRNRTDFEKAGVDVFDPFEDRGER